MFYPLHTANMQAIKAIGKSGTYLTLELVKKSIELICLLLVMRISVKAIAINMAILTTLFTFINAYPNKKYLDYSIREQISDIISPIIMSVIMSFTVYIIGSLLNLPDLWRLLIQVLCGGLVYISLSLITKNKEYEYLVNLIISKIHHG